MILVVGTRPECIKVAPLVKALKEREISHTVLHTQQHTDLWHGTGLVPDQILPEFPSHTDLFAQADRLQALLTPYLQGQSVLVQGDTLTAYAAALACGPGQTLIHLEAGVRSGNLKHPWPEETFRVGIDALTDLAFCATASNAANLHSEGYTGQWFITGNTGVDACLSRQQYVPMSQRHPGLIVLTLHRRESFGEPIRRILTGVAEFARAHGDVRVHWPVHPNPDIAKSLDGLELPRNIRRGPPLAYGTFLNKLAHAQMVVTDSGGVQEDACTLGVPGIICREVTDRPESVSLGHSLLAGRTAGGVVDGMTSALRGELRTDPGFVFGDGRAAPVIADLLRNV